MLHLWVEDALDRLAKYLFLSHWLSLLFLSLHHSFLFYHLRLYGNITPTDSKVSGPSNRARASLGKAAKMRICSGTLRTPSQSIKESTILLSAASPCGLPTERTWD